MGVELPHQFGQIGPGRARGGGELVLALGDGLGGRLRALLGESLDHVLQGGGAGLLAGAARLFEMHGGFRGPGELLGREGLPAPGHHVLLGGQAGGQHLACLVLGAVLLVCPGMLEDVEGLAECVGRLGGACVCE